LASKAIEFVEKNAK